MTELNPTFLKIRQYLNTVISHWQRTKAGNPSFNDIRESMKTDTLEGYNKLVERLYLDLNFTEGDNLQKLIDEVEKPDEHIKT